MTANEARETLGLTKKVDEASREAVIEINGYEIKDLTSFSLSRYAGEITIRAEQPLRTASPGFREAWKQLKAKKKVKLRLVLPDCIVSGKFSVEDAGEIYMDKDFKEGQHLFWTTYGFAASIQSVTFSWESGE